jgi:hypothetical protein
MWRRSVHCPHSGVSWGERTIEDLGEMLAAGLTAQGVLREIDG